MRYIITQEITTPESAELGDFESTDLLLETDNLREACECLYETRTNMCGGISGKDKLENSLIVTNGAEFESGAIESRTLIINSDSMSDKNRALVLNIANKYLEI